MNRGRRFGRLLGIVSEVVLQPGQTPVELARALGVSERTLFRDLMELRGLGVDISFSEGYQLQERFELEGRASGEPVRAAALPVVYEQQLRLLRSRFSPAVAARVQAEVEAAGPAALAELFGRAIEKVTAGPDPSRGGRP